MMVLTLGFGVVLQFLASLGLARLVQFRLGARELSTCFAMGAILESMVLALLSLTMGLPVWVLQLWFFIKVGAGCLGCSTWWPQMGRWGWPVWAFAVMGIMNASVPTSNFDCFSAHFPIAKLFLEAEGYPWHRVDVQYLEALPLGAHLWFLPQMSWGLEGAVNAIGPVFGFFSLLALREHLGPRGGLWGALLCLGMPQFLRVTMDPMVDAALFFFVLKGALCLPKNSNWGLAALFLSFPLAIKPTLLPLGLLALYLCIRWPNRSFRVKGGLLFAMAAMVLLWPLKNWVQFGNLFHPYLFSQGEAPWIPMESRVAPLPWFEHWLNYVKVVFLDHRYALSLGFWPLLALPLAWRFANRRPLLAVGMVVGFLLTGLLTPFKNRYFMPFLFLALPAFSISLVVSKHRVTKGLVVLQAVLVMGLFVPYAAQSLHALVKNLNHEDFIQRKYPFYPGYRVANELPEGRILLVGQASHWIERDHRVAIVSETHLDFTRLSSIEELIHHLDGEEIVHVVFDRRDALGMAAHEDPWYRGKAHCARRAIHWMDRLKERASAVQEVAGIDLITGWGSPDQGVGAEDAEQEEQPEEELEVLPK